MLLKDHSYVEPVEYKNFKSVKANVTKKIADLLKLRLYDEKIKMFSAIISKECDVKTVPMDLMKDIAMEYCENDDNCEYCEMSRHAFECLKEYKTDLPNDFYEKYYLKIKKRIKHEPYENAAIKKLDDYMKSCGKAEKYQMLRALTICLLESVCGVKISVFNEYHSLEWGKELLMYSLLSNNITWDVKQVPDFAREISKLDAFIKANTINYCIEDIVEILIEAQNFYQMDVKFIIKIVKLLRSNVKSLDVISREICFLPSLLDELETLKLMAICDQRKIIYTDETQLMELHNLLFYSEETINLLLAKVKENTNIIELIDLFETLKNNELMDKEEFLRQLAPNKNIDIWKRELFFPLIQTFICREFPRYDCYLPCVGSSIAQKNADAMYFANSKPSNKKSYTSYCEFDKTTKEELNRLLEEPAKGLVLAQMLHDLNRKLAKLLLKCGWSNKTLKIIEKWIECLDNEKKVAELIGTLDILAEYDMDITEDALSKLTSRSTLANVQKEIHKFVINKTFPGTYEKTVDQLIDELVELNASDRIPLLENKRLLRENYDKVMSAYATGTSELISSNKIIKHWTVSEIEEWSQLFTTIRLSKVSKFKQVLDAISPAELAVFKDKVASISEFEIVAVIKRAMELISGVNLRVIQLLSVIIMVNSKESKGRLAQVNTGEGKTMIIAMIAAYHAIRSHRVDIITSSRLLAIPQSEQQSKFYDTLGIVVAHNFDSSGAYLHDIVYGTSQEFQGDILIDEFRKREIRHGRKCDVAIVDEVDNMLIDGNNHIVMLSSYMPAMDHLEPILAAIYSQVKAAAASIVERDGVAYFVDQENAVDENGEVMKDFVVNHVPIEGTKREFIEKSTEKHIRRLIRDGDTSDMDKNFPEIKIPNHLRELICKVSLKKWVNRALSALFYYRKGEEYILVNDEVKIVDALNTGVVQPDMIWSDGLHQFIQIQHGAKITPERLTTNFISNVAFFRRYRPKIYGLTGTLGSSGTKRLLNKTYDVDTVIIPPFKLKQHKELEAIIVRSSDDWYRAIARSCLRKLNNDRAVLVIMEYIRETELLEKTFTEEFSYDKKKIKIYKTNEDSAVVDKALKPGEVIITTNIAGRGTDIKLSKDIDDNGGLHVCVTFLPKNSRVEQQNTGRTARTGNRGTSQFILLNSETDIRELRDARMKKEEAAMKSAESDIDEVTNKDMIFQKFCHLINKVKGRNEFVREIEREAVEERFGIWLAMNDDRMSEGDKDDVLNDFKAFEEKVLTDDRNNNLIRNPYMYVNIGNKYLEKEKYKDAINEYSSAINLDNHFAEHAYYNRGYAYIAQYGDNVSGNKYYIDRAVEDFEKARSLIEDRERSLHLEQSASNGEVFSEKIRNKLNLYNVQKNAIDVAIGPDLVAINAQIDQLKNDKKSDKLTSEEKKEIEDTIENLNKLKKNVGVIQSARSKGNDIKIERHAMKDVLPDDAKSHDNEIKEIELNGAIGSFEVSEIPPIDWSAVISLLALGFGQLILGAALTVFTLGGGASFGMGLISEGISDIITAVKDGIINRSFSWATWAIEKAISLTISVVCAGFKAMKDVAKTAYAGTKTAATICSKAITQTAKNGLKIVAKKVGWELAKGAGKGIVTELINLGVNKTLIPLIQEAIVDKIKGPIEQALLDNSHVRSMLQLDEKNNNRHYENRIKDIGLNILNPAKNTDILSIAKRIATGVAEKKIPGFATFQVVSNALVGVVELTTFTNSFINKLNSSIKKEADKDKIQEQLTAKSETKLEQKDKKCATTSDTLSEETGKDIDLKRLDDDHEQVKLNKQERDPGSISKTFVKVMSTSMVNIIQGKMIAPVVQYGVNYTCDKITSNIEESMSKELETYRSHKRIIHYQNNGFSKKQKETKREYTAEEHFAMKKVDEIIDNTRKGGPSGLVHLGAASEAIDKPIEVYDDKGRWLYTIGEDKRGKSVKVEYHKGKNGDTIGHYTLPGGREPINNKRNGNLCLYNVIGEQTGHDSKALKNSTLTIMKKNKDQVAKQANDITYLQTYAEMKLAMGGAEFSAKTPNETALYIENSIDAKAYGFNAKGHGNKHYPHKNNEDRLKAIAKETDRQVVVGMNCGDCVLLQPPIGDESKHPPIVLEYHGDANDNSNEYYTSIAGKEVYRLHDPLDKTLYKIVAKQIKHPDATQLASNVRNRITNEKLSKNINCLENAIIKSNHNSGYTSKAEMNYVMLHAMNTKEAKEARAELNKYKANIVDGIHQRRKVVTLTKEQLGLKRDAFATGKVEVKPGQFVQCVWPVESVRLLLQHHDDHQGNPDAPVHIHTTFPLKPGNMNAIVEGNEWGPANKKDWR